MKRAFYFMFLSLFLVWAGCKKDRRDDPKPNEVEITRTDVQVQLPDGVAMDLSKTKIFTLGSSTGVDADGKANIPFLEGAGQLVWLFDESDNLVMQAYLTNASKEISVKTTAQALLFQGLQLPFLPDSSKVAFLQKSASSPKLEEYYTAIQQAFKADQLMLERRSFGTALSTVLSQLMKEKTPLDMFAKQIHIVDEDTRSKLKIEEEDVEHVNILNQAYRRAHAFVYKTAFRNQNNVETVINSTVNFDDAADKDLKVEKIRFISNAFDQIGVAQGFKTATTGPVHLPLADNEKEATYKIRILGPGKPVSASLTNAEQAKLDELYYEYLAYDILAPLMLEAMGYKSLISKINEDALKPFSEKVKIIAKTDETVMAQLRKGTVKGSVDKFYDAMAAAGQTETLLMTSLLDCMKADLTGMSFPSAETLENYEKQIQKGINLLKYATGVVSGSFILAPHSYYNEMEEFEVKARDNNVKLSPQTSMVTNFTNHPMTVNANAELSGNQTLWYKWSTSGKYGGIIKSAGKEGQTVETDQASVNFYSNASSSQLGENNIEQVFVTAYVKEGSALTAIGSDTATVNVKKNVLVMNPTNPTLNLTNGGKNSVKLYLLKADGTRDIAPNPVLDYKVTWSTAGTYGNLANNSTEITTYDDDAMTYTAFDDEVEKATENILAKVYYKPKASTNWILREEVKGKVTIENDEKKIVYYSALTSYHHDRNDWHYTNCGIAIPPMEDALTYSVQITIPTVKPSTYSETWSASDPGWLHGYMYGIDPNTTGTYYVGYGASWGGCNDCEHTVADCSGGQAKVTIILK